MAGGKHKARSPATVRLSNPLYTADSASTRRSTSGGVFQSRTRISAIPGQKKKAYAQALPQNDTKLAGACLMDIRSTTNAIWDNRFWVKMFRILWWIDSTRKSDPVDPLEQSELAVEDLCDTGGQD